MPKPIIDIKNKEINNFAQNLTFNQKTNFQTPELAFRKKRSEKYIKTLKKLDMIEHHITQEQINEITNAIKNELPEISIDELPIGIVAKCYLGEPYEVHTLSFLGKSIIRHYKLNESLPDELEKARTLANNENYEFVEVYHNKLIAVKEDGSTAIVENKN